ncbi:MAG: hypothetical protein SFW09_16805 [Hyphomicrobiaceae bacterium]|nr:hypothetical protein [Hyphomicrobiaceae bacterium]
MTKIAGSIAALALVLTAGSAVAQTKAPNPVDAKFVAADVDKSGSLEGKEVDAFKADLAKIDTNKDGKISSQEFDVAVKTGLVK